MANGTVRMILTYHEITRTPCPYVYSVTHDQMAEHLACIAGWSSPPTMTFDDGYRSQYDVAVSLLEAHRCLGMFFVSAGWIETRPGYMRWSDVAELAARGHEVQSHGWSHKHLTLCSDGELRNELLRSKNTIEEKLARPVDAISAPGGRWDTRVALFCAEVGYRRLYVSDPWQRSTRAGMTVAGRFMVRRTTSASDVLKLARASETWISGPRLRHVVKWGVRQAVGSRLYQILWERFAAAESRPEA